MPGRATGGPPWPAPIGVGAAAQGLDDLRFRKLCGTEVLTPFRGDATIRAEPFEAIELSLAPLWDEVD